MRTLILHSIRKILLTTRLYSLFFVYVNIKEKEQKYEIHLMPFQIIKYLLNIKILTKQKIGIKKKEFSIYTIKHSCVQLGIVYQRLNAS